MCIRIDGKLTVEKSSNPMENGSPEVYPSHKVKIGWRIWFAGKDVNDGLIEHGNRPCEIIEMRLTDIQRLIHASNASDGEGLGPKYWEYKRGHEGGH